MMVAITSGKVLITSHPGNPKYPVEVKAIAQAAKHHVALEINNSSLSAFA